MSRSTFLGGGAEAVRGWWDRVADWGQTYSTISYNKLVTALPLEKGTGCSFFFERLAEKKCGGDHYLHWP